MKGRGEGEGRHASYRRWVVRGVEPQWEVGTLCAPSSCSHPAPAPAVLFNLPAFPAACPWLHPSLPSLFPHPVRPVAGLPAGTIHLSGSEPDESQHNWLAAVGSFMLEFSSLAQRTGEPKYLAAAERGIRRLHRCYPKKASWSMEAGSQCDAVHAV